MNYVNPLKNALNRRSFLAGAGGAAAATFVSGCSDNGLATLPAVTSYTDIDILQFALNLEYLEAEYYLRAATGSGLSSADIGSNPGSVTGGTKIAFTAQTTGLALSATTQQNIADEIAYTEQQHVRALRAAITAAGATPISRPAIDLVNSFNAIASAAGIGATFNAFASFDALAIGIFAFEDVGVSAYNGAAPLISAAGVAAGYLATAAGILAVEAYHAATGRGYLTGQATIQGSTAYPYLGYANAIANVRSLLSGGSTTTLADESKLLIPAGTSSATVTVSPSQAANVDSNAFAFARTTDQVLHVVYGMATPTSSTGTPTAGVSMGGFFPSGLNGNIHTTLS